MKKFIIFALCVFIIGCMKKHNLSSSGKLNVLCTTSIIADCAKNIGKDKITLNALMEPGVDPHLYKAKEGDIELMQNADIILFNGLHLEAKMADILIKMNEFGTYSVAIGDNIEESLLIEHQRGLHDPHIWMSVSIWTHAVKNITKALIKKDFKNKSYYISNEKEYIKKLEALDKYIKNLVKKIPKKKRTLVSAHDAFAYFGKTYGLKVLAIQGISTQAEAGTSDIRALADYIFKNKIGAVFLETTISPRTINALKEAVNSRGYNLKIGGELYSDSLGDKNSNAATYIGMIKHNAETICTALKAD